MFCCELNTIIDWKWMSFDYEKYEEGDINLWTTKLLSKLEFDLYKIVKMGWKMEYQARILGFLLGDCFVHLFCIGTLELTN